MRHSRVIGLAGQGRAGQDRTGQGRAGQGRPGQGRAGLGWAGLGWAGLRRTKRSCIEGFRIMSIRATIFRISSKRSCLEGFRIPAGSKRGPKSDSPHTTKDHKGAQGPTPGATQSPLPGRTSLALLGKDNGSLHPNFLKLFIFIFTSILIPNSYPY